MMRDIEHSDAWLHGLWRLNEAIEVTGEGLRGNVCYADLQENFTHKPPAADMKVKRDRIRAVVAGRRRLLEVGVNGGHSAYIALTANEDLEYHGVDICEHAYVRPAISALTSLFPGRVFLYEGNGLDILPMLANEGQTFDTFCIDGAKHLYLHDVLNCSRMTGNRDAWVIMDDTQLRSVSWVWRTSVRLGLIVPIADFLPGPPDAHDQNAAGLLRPLPSWKWHFAHRAYANIPPLAAWLRRQSAPTATQQTATRRLGPDTTKESRSAGW